MTNKERRETLVAQIKAMKAILADALLGNKNETDFTP